MLIKSSPVTFTVIGFYEDNNQTWTDYVEGQTAIEVTIKALSKRQKYGNPVVVEVFEGLHKGLLENTTLLALQHGILTEIGEE